MPEPFQFRVTATWMLLYSPLNELMAMDDSIADALMAQGAEDCVLAFDEIDDHCTARLSATFWVDADDIASATDIGHRMLYAAIPKPVSIIGMPHPQPTSSE